MRKGAFHMYTVLLVDDEKSVTESLKTAIPWANLGVKAVYTAGDGLQALGLLSNIHIDLLITDIRMPHMDGLTLLKTVRSDYPDIHCILLTAYGEFDYAIQAMKLGVDNYLMKPIQMQELTETIENALDNIYTNRKNKEVLFRENILRRWITGNISADELGERSVLIDINIYQTAYCILAVKKLSDSVSLTAFGQECCRQFPDDLDCSCLWDNSGLFLFHIGGGSIPQEKLTAILNQTAQRLKITSLISASVGITVHDRMELQRSYQSALELLNAAPSGHSSMVRTSKKDAVQTLPAVAELQPAAISPIIQRTLDYIENHYSEGVSMKEFSASLNMNTAYLGYLFKKETGMFFNNYLNDLRLEKAAALLCTTGDRISDVALKTGFTTTSHFITTFKKKTGLSPLKYRETYAGVLR